MNHPFTDFLISTNTQENYDDVVLTCGHSGWDFLLSIAVVAVGVFLICVYLV